LDSADAMMKLLSKLGEYVAMAIGFPVLVACVLAFLCLSGILFLALVACLTKAIFGAWLDNMPVPPIGYIIYAATGGLVWLCGTVVWHAWERRRAVEEEIKIVSDIYWTTCNAITGWVSHTGWVSPRLIPGSRQSLSELRSAISVERSDE
jgi:hypothetical protein